VTSPKVGFVIGQLTCGGAERQLALLSKKLRAGSSILPVVFCLSGSTSPLGQVLTDFGVEWIHADTGLGPGLPRLFWLVRSLSRFRCDLLYGLLNVGSIYACAASTLTGAPFIASIRNADPHLPPSVRRPSALACNLARMVVANSASCLSSLRTHLGVRHNRVVVIENGVEDLRNRELERGTARARLGLPADAMVFCTLANLKPQKRPSFFIDVFKHYHAYAESRAHFVWQGSGPERPAVEEMWARFPANEQTYLHFLPESSTPQDLLACSDVFLLTSEYEGMPNALLEAMAAGLPCVVADVAGTRDVFSAPDGTALDVCVAVPPDDPKSFAEALAELVRDPERMSALGQRAKAHVQQRFSVEKMVDRHVEVFEQLLRSRRSRVIA
jgi:glycosyltransferase involved in cell wall biosynthesis